MTLAATPDGPRAATVCNGKWRLVERMLGSVDESVWLAEPGALVTIGWSTNLPASELTIMLALPFAGVTPLLAVGTVDGEDRDAVVEARPRGAPSPMAASDIATACRWGAEVAIIAARAHESGASLGGLRPEAVWIENGAVTAVAPRATRLWELRATDMGIVPGHPTVLLSPERLVGGDPSEADDVFALAATMATWASGRYPFAGETRDTQLLALLKREWAPFDGPPRLGVLLSSALGDAAGRPSMASFGTDLAALAQVL